jgi:hypothetical protein
LRWSGVSARFPKNALNLSVTYHQFGRERADASNSDDTPGFDAGLGVPKNGDSKPRSEAAVYGDAIPAFGANAFVKGGGGGPAKAANGLCGTNASKAFIDGTGGCAPMSEPRVFVGSGGGGGQRGFFGSDIPIRFV